MPRYVALAFVLVALAGFSRAAKPEPIFNGKNLDGWTIFADPKSKGALKPLENWIIKDGIIVNKGMPTSYLRTEATYSNYKFQFDWRYPVGSTPDSNSGALIHMQKPLEKIWPVCLEPQGRYKDHGKIFPMGVAVKNNVFDVKALEKVRKPIGEWNTTRIECDKNGGVVVFVNDERVASCTSPLKEGPVGFQSEGHEIHFRAISIEKLD